MMLLAQVSDTHLVGDASASVWGQNPATNLASVLDAMPPVDAIAVTGDIADDGTVEAYRLADSLMQRRARRRYFIPGNHDDPAAMAAVFGDVEDLRLVVLSEHWVLALMNSQWIGRESRTHRRPHARSPARAISIASTPMWCCAFIIRRSRRATSRSAR